MNDIRRLFNELSTVGTESFCWIIKKKDSPEYWTDKGFQWVNDINLATRYPNDFDELDNTHVYVKLSIATKEVEA